MLSDGSTARIWRWYAGWSVPAAFVLVFVHVQYQPALAFHGVSADTADLAIALAVICALLTVREDGAARRRLAASLWLWAGAAAFLAFVVAACLYPRLNNAHYATTTHLVTAAKFIEYALLAPATAVLVRDVGTLRRLLAAVAAVALAAGLVGVVQFFGVDIFRAWPQGNRQPSFSGIPTLAALGGASLAIGFAGLLWPGTAARLVRVVALAGGAACLVLSGEAAGGLALVAIAVASVLAVARRRGVARGGVLSVAAVTAACALGLLALRGGDITQFARYLGILKPNRATTANVQTYAQRTLMYYIGLRIFEAHPLIGSGWQAVREKEVYTPFLAAAHRRFPTQPAQAFPSSTHPWGIDDAYIQSLAELGLLGTALFLALLGSGLRLGVVRALRGPPEHARVALLGLLWLLVAMGIWFGQGLVAGIGFEALAWFGVGLIAAGWTASPSGATPAAAT
jgi:O-antigen ligase